MTIKPHVARFYEVLPLMGINMVNQHHNEIQRVADAIQAIEHVPDEWWDHMVAFGKEHGVKSPMKVVTGLEQWLAVGGPPGLRNKTKTTTYDDNFIVRYTASQRDCGCENYPECQPAWRWGPARPPIEDVAV